MKKLHQIKSWGVDVGNVIFSNFSESVQLTHQQENYTAQEIADCMTLIPNAIIGLKALVEKVDANNIWLISKAGEKRISTVKLAFEKFNMFNLTGIKKEQVLFVPNRQDKIPIVKSLELEGYIDDRGEIISSVQKFVKCPLWFCPSSKDSEKWARKMHYSVRVISGWKQLMEIY